MNRRDYHSSMLKCAVQHCGKEADVEVVLFDVLATGEVFFEQDFTCPYLCTEHVVENEAGCFSRIGRSELAVTLQQVATRYEAGDRRMDRAISNSIDRSLSRAIGESSEDVLGGARIPALRDHGGSPHYPYTNKHDASGFTIYRPLHR